jgi:ABC-type spermidine/putrescine transport system permease subunit II
VIEVLRLLRPGIMLGAGAVALVMMGSAVPLHLAQVQTLAIHLWKYMSLTPEPIWAWVGAWPLVGLAVLGGVTAARSIGGGSNGSAPEPPGDAARGSRWVIVAAILVWGLAVLVPLVLNLSAIHDWSSIGQFWRGSLGALVNSLQTAAITGGLVALITLSVWRLASERAGFKPRAARGLTGVLVAAALTPGVLIGAAGVALASAEWFPIALARTNAVLVCVHVARFGAVGAMVGLWLAAQESPDERASRELYSPGFAGWARTQLVPAWSGPVGAALAAAALSLHEIEATVLVAPPGAGNLAQRVLDLLHYARDEQLAAASIGLVLGGLAISELAMLLISHAARRGNTITKSTEKTG